MTPISITVYSGAHLRARCPHSVWGRLNHAGSAELRHLFLAGGEVGGDADTFGTGRGRFRSGNPAQHITPVGGREVVKWSNVGG